MGWTERKSDYVWDKTYPTWVGAVYQAQKIQDKEKIFAVVGKTTEGTFEITTKNTVEVQRSVNEKGA